MRPPPFRPRLDAFEGRIVPAVIPPDAVAVGSDVGSPPLVQVIDPASGQTLFTMQAFAPGFTGGVRVAVGDVTGDGVPDLVTAAGPGGGPQINVTDGQTGQTVRSFFAYEPGFTGGVRVAVGDVNGDGRGDIIVGTGAGGGPRVSVFDGRTGAEIENFMAYENTFRGGVNVAAGDVNGDGADDIVVGTGAGGAPRVAVYSGKDPGTVLSNFFAYDPSFRNGVNVGSADLNGDGDDDVLTGAGAGGGPHVRAVSGKDGSELANFFAFDPSARNGVQVAGVDTNGDGKAELVAATGGAGAAQQVRRFDDPSGGGMHDLGTAGARGGANLGGERPPHPAAGSPTSAATPEDTSDPQSASDSGSVRAGALRGADTASGPLTAGGSTPPASTPTPPTRPIITYDANGYRNHTDPFPIIDPAPADQPTTAN